MERRIAPSTKIEDRLPGRGRVPGSAGKALGGLGSGRREGRCAAGPGLCSSQLSRLTFMAVLPSIRVRPVI